LDDKARAGLRIIEGGLPEGVSAIDHLSDVAELPAELSYAIGFEKDTPGLDEAAGRETRRGGYSMSERLLAGDPALDGIGWAGGGPWAVIILRARRLGPDDTPALEKGLETAIAQERPALRPDPALKGLAAIAVINSDVSYQDVEGFGLAGGVPVHLEYSETETFLPSQFLNIRLDKKSPASLHEPWLSRFGAAAKITDTGTVVYVVLAAGEADRPALVRQIAEAEPRAAELVNRERTKLSLPEVRLDARLVTAAREVLLEAVKRKCFSADDHCAAPFPDAAESSYQRRSTWFSPEEAFTWDLGRDEGDDTYRRFGVAATIGPDGMVWSVLLLA